MEVPFWPFRQDKLKNGSYTCILASMRTGSNLLQSYINTCEQTICLGELFNPNFVGVNRPDIGSETFAGYYQTDVKKRNEDKRAFFNSIYKATQPRELVFRLFDGHDKNVMRTVLSNQHCRKIILTRDDLESFISLEIAMATKQWLLRDSKDRKFAPVEFYPERYLQFAEDTSRYYDSIFRRLEQDHQNYIRFDYSDLNNLERVNQLLSFIKPDLYLKSLPNKLVRQNPSSLKDKVTNYKFMRDFIASGGGRI